MSATATTATPARSGELVPIRIGALFPPTTVAVDLYLGCGEPGGRPRVLYSRANSPPTERNLLKLQESGITTLYATREQASELLDQFHDLLRSGVPLPPEMNLELARECVRADLAKAWTEARTDGLIVHSGEFADLIVEICQPGTDTLALINSLLKHDGDTFTHVSNVCVYTVLMLRKLGFSDAARLTALGQAALLHDLGKRHVEKNILRKPTALTRRERAIIADHPRLGFEELCERPDLDRDQLLMAYQHHERLDGSGYPVGLVGDEIHWTGRLCAVVDVFDALTGRRPYREPSSAEEAIDYLQQGVVRHFDKEYVQCLASLACRGSS
jgi:HD-GYP domain-containing protein (c-di-GMP phosphodiesterase class II)